MKRQPKSQKLNVVGRWTAAVRGVVKVRRLGKPKGELNLLVRMEQEWSKIPNGLYEDAAGQLWLAFVHGDRLQGEIDPEGGFEAATVEEALAWIQNVTEYVDGWDGDVADVCRIALAELARRPTDFERVKRAVMEDIKATVKEDWQAISKSRRARKAGH